MRESNHQIGALMKLSPIDHVTKAVPETVEVLGFTVDVFEPRPGHHVVQAVNKTTGETFVVRADDLYVAVCELAGRVGIELEDG